MAKLISIIHEDPSIAGPLVDGLRASGMTDYVEVEGLCCLMNELNCRPTGQDDRLVED